MKKHAVVSLSGGLDSTTVLLHALANYDTVTAISFDYGQKHRVELERALSCVSYINTFRKTHSCHHDHNTSGFKHGQIEGRVDYPFPKVQYQVVQLKGLTPLLNSALVEGGDEVPEGHYEQENMKETVVPNRNKIFSSITQAVALSIANKTGENCDVLLGVHSGDHAIYPDCKDEFRNADEHAFRIGNWDSERVSFIAPYMEGNKFSILQDGEKLCEELGVDFNEVYKRTNTSYKPYPSGNSDYKSASSVERIEAFIALGRPDPVTYEDEEGIASWDKVVSHVKKVLVEHGK